MLLLLPLAHAAAAQDLKIEPCSAPILAAFEQEGAAVASCRAGVIELGETVDGLRGLIRNSAGSGQRILVLVDDRVVFDTGYHKGDRDFVLERGDPGCRIDLVALEGSPQRWRHLELRSHSIGWTDNGEEPEALDVWADFDDRNLNDPFDVRFELRGEHAGDPCAANVS